MPNSRRNDGEETLLFNEHVARPIGFFSVHNRNPLAVEVDFGRDVMFIIDVD